MIDKYKQAFQEEAREILVDLEATLLRLNQNREDAELVDQAFRALHTIKGSGSMFGFDDVAAFTHKLENAYDEVRNGRLQVTSQLVDLSLAALDQIKSMLDHAVGEVLNDIEGRTNLLNQLRQLTGLSEGPSERPATVVSPTSAQPPILTKSLASSPSELTGQEWHIHFAPGPDLLRNGTDPLLLLRELRQLGTLEISVTATALPALAELDPERCYLVWEMVLNTAATRDDIHDVFIFAEDQCDLTIEPAQCALANPVAPVENATDGPATTPQRRLDDRPSGESNIRVATVKLDQFVDLVGELVTVQARLSEIASRHEDPDLVAVSEEVERLSSALRENSMSIRMLPVRGTFERFRRLVHDLARDLHKEVELTIDGAETELDKTVIDQLNDPLMHLIRNSMDHGIETPDVREAAGKPRVATVHLSALHSGANVHIVVSDDGGGIHADAVRQRAVARGLVAPEAVLSESEIFALILLPGFSTAPTVTDVSGRGVGMDVVRQRVEALRGNIHIASTPGVGTTVTLRLPLTLAIIDGLLVRVGEAFFILPLANSIECIELTRQDILDANGKHLAHIRGEVIPYIRLREYFEIRSPRPEIEQIMIAETDNGRCGFVVDEVLGDHQTVIKNLGRFYRHVDFISGATILGDGSLALILDPNRVVKDALQSAAVGPARATLANGPPPPPGPDELSVLSTLSNQLQ